MAMVEANGINICYEDSGTGEPILLIAGLGAQLVDWPDQFVDALVARGFRVVRHDNRDAGLSTEFDWEPPSNVATLAALVRPQSVEVGYELADMADDARALLDALKIDKAHIVGHSMGGMIAQTLAIAHPSKVSSLTSLMSNTGDRRNGVISPRILPKLVRTTTPTRAEAPAAQTEMFELWAGSTWDKNAHLDDAKRSVERSYRPVGTERQTAAIVAAPDRTDDLAKLEIPTLVIHGLEDKLVLPSGGVATASAVPNSRLLMFPEMGHDFPDNRIDEMTDAIRINADRAGNRP